MLDGDRRTERVLGLLAAALLLQQRCQVHLAADGVGVDAELQRFSVRALGFRQPPRSPQLSCEVRQGDGPHLRVAKIDRSALEALDLIGTALPLEEIGQRARGPGCHVDVAEGDDG